MTTEPEVYTTESGLAVVTDDAESVRVALRRQRRIDNRRRRQKAAQRRTGGSKGRATWIEDAKGHHAYERMMNQQ